MRFDQPDRFPQSAAFRPVPSDPPPILRRMGDDLATEALAGARWRWGSHLAPADDRFAWLIELDGAVLAAAAERRRVLSVERRRRMWLARTSPPLHILREIVLSGLVDAQALPDRERDRHEP